MPSPKPKSKIKKSLLITAGLLVLIFGVFFIMDFIKVRGQILSGEFEQYGQQVSGTAGANIDQAGQYKTASGDDPSIGEANAPITIVEFADFECPWSGKAYPIIRSLVGEYKGTIRFIYRDFPLSEINPNAELAARAGYCAQMQEKFWSMHDKLFQNQKNLSRDDILSYAAQVGLEPEKFSRCLDSAQAKAEVAEDAAAGKAAGVQGTPTWFINGIRVAGVIPKDKLEKVIEELLK